MARPLENGDLAIIKFNGSSDNYVVYNIVLSGPNPGIDVKYVIEESIRQHLIYVPDPDPSKQWKVEGNDSATVTFQKVTKVLTGITEIDKKILSDLDLNDAISLCASSKSASLLCQDPKMWIERYERTKDLIPILRGIHSLGLGPDFDMSMFAWLEPHIDEIDEENYIDIVEAIKYYVSVGSIPMIEYLYDNYKRELISTKSMKKVDFNSSIKDLMMRDFNSVVVPVINYFVEKSRYNFDTGRWGSDWNLPGGKSFPISLINQAWVNLDQTLQDYLARQTLYTDDRSWIDDIGKRFEEPPITTERLDFFKRNWRYYNEILDLGKKNPYGSSFLPKYSEIFTNYLLYAMKSGRNDVAIWVMEEEPALFHKVLAWGTKQFHHPSS